MHVSHRGGEADLEAARQREAELAAALSDARAEAEAAQQAAEDRLDRLRRQAADSEDRFVAPAPKISYYLRRRFKLDRLARADRQKISSEPGGTRCTFC